MNTEQLTKEQRCMYSLVVAWQFLVPSRRTLERSRCPFRQSLTLWARARARSYERVVAVVSFLF